MPEPEPVGPVTVRTPSTIGNFGPGFDATSLALAWGGDTLHVSPAEADTLEVTGHAQGVPDAWAANGCSLAFGHLRDTHAPGTRFRLRLEKGVLPGSGLGSSASSCAAGALGFAKAFPGLRPWTPLELVEAAGVGEAQVAGHHADDVAAAVLGGLSLVRPGEVGRVTPPTSLHLAIVLPRMVLETRTMRAAVPETVPVPDAVANLANLAFLVDAMHRGDIATIAHSLEDRIAVPGRSAHLPHFDPVRDAAKEAGALGCTISGSGPAMFAVTEDKKAAHAIAEAMADAVAQTGTEATPIACQAERRQVMDQIRRPDKGTKRDAA